MWLLMYEGTVGQGLQVNSHAQLKSYLLDIMGVFKMTVTTNLGLF